MSLENFVDGFIACAMWLGKHYETEEQAENGNGEDLDAAFDRSDLPEYVLKEILEDCAGFYDNHAHLWADEPNYDDDTAGHDFFLSRNGHGAGFWDRGLENGDEIHAATKPYGTFGLEKFAGNPIDAHH